MTYTYIILPLVPPLRHQSPLLSSLQFAKDFPPRASFTSQVLAYMLSRGYVYFIYNFQFKHTSFNSLIELDSYKKDQMKNYGNKYDPS